MRLARVGGGRIEHAGAGGGYCSATSGVTAMWSEIISRSKPRPSTVCAQWRNTPGSVPGPKFGTFTPIRTRQGYPAVIEPRLGRYVLAALFDGGARGVPQDTWA